MDWKSRNNKSAYLADFDFTQELDPSQNCNLKVTNFALLVGIIFTILVKVKFVGIHR
jgi:hypothetical protein